MRIKKLTEKEFMAQVVQLARLRGWMVYHTHDSRRSVAGFPDLLLLRGNCEIVVELKVGKNKVTAEQEQWLQAFRRAGRAAFVWRPDDWNVIENTLQHGIGSWRFDP